MCKFEKTIRILSAGAAGIAGMIATLLLSSEKADRCLTNLCLVGLLSYIITDNGLNFFVSDLHVKGRNDPTAQQIMATTEQMKRDVQLLRRQFLTIPSLAPTLFSNKTADPYGLVNKIESLASILENRGKIDELPKDIFCPINMTVMKDPVQTSSGHSYERSALQSYYCAGGMSCPMNRSLPLENPRTLPTNLALQIRIHAILQEKLKNTSSTPKDPVQVSKHSLTQ